MPDQFPTERLAYWYLRLNGFLILENFIIHPDTGSNQRTDADLLGVRLAHRAENLVRPMEDDDRVSQCNTLINVVIAEIKSSACALNGPWTNPDAKNIQRVLAAVGCVPESQRDLAASGLYKAGRFVTDAATIRLMAFGDHRSKLQPEVPQVLFNEMIEFMYKRFRDYKRQKSSVGNWTPDGFELKNLADRAKTSAEFVEVARSTFGLPVSNLQGLG